MRFTSRMFWTVQLRRAAGVVAAGALLGSCALSQAGIITTADEAYPATKEVFTVDPHAGTNANRGFDTTRELRQSFKNPTTFDVHKIVVSVDVNKTTAGFYLNFWEVADVNVTPITTATGVGNPVNGTLIHTITLPAGSYTNTNQRLGITLTDSDVFSLPQRDAGTTGYVLAIGQLDTSVTATGVWVFSNTGADLYANGKFYTETGAQSSATRDGGIAISSVPEPASWLMAVMALAGLIVCKHPGRSVV